MNEPYSEDAVIIKQYSLLYACYGNTLAFCKALDIIKIPQDPDKQVIWKSIFTGIKYQVAGDYDTSLAEFEKVGNLIGKNTLLDIFYQKEKLFSFVFSARPDVARVQTEYQRLRDQYKDNTDPLIESQIVSTMVHESYVIWKLRDKDELLIIDDKIIETYEKSLNNDIQLSVAIAMNNKANMLSRLALDARAVSLLDEIEKKYKNNNDPRIIKQVIRAIKSKALIFYEDADLERAHVQYKKITDTYSGKKQIFVFEDFLVDAFMMQARILDEMNKNSEALDLYNTVYISHKNSDNLNVQERVLFAVLLEMDLLKKTGKFDKQIKIADNAMGQFLKNDNTAIQLKLLEIMFEKARTLYQQGKWDKEIRVYNSIIKRHKSADSPSLIKDQVLRAMRYKISSLRSMGYIDRAIQAYDEAISFRAESEDPDASGLLALQVEKTDLLIVYGDYEGYEKNYKDIYEKYINSDNAEIRRIIALFMFNRAFKESYRGNLLEEMQLYRDIIRLFGDDTSIDVVETVTRAICGLGCMLGRAEKWNEAIEALYGVKRYANYDNAAIQSEIAHALNNRIVYLGITGDKKEEVKAYEEFIEMFKSSDNEEIKNMVFTAESELPEKKRNLEDEAAL